jgi:uncharacterized protein (TIGR02147 family)
MVDLFIYTDYRKFLRDFFDECRKNKSFLSLRYYAGKLGLDPGNFVKILNSERHLSRKTIQRTIDFLKLSKREGDYFRTLVAFAKAKKQSDIKGHFERLAAMKRIEPFEITSAMAEIYRAWYYTAVAGLLSYYPFNGDYIALARQLAPSITVKQAKESIRLLTRTGIIKKDSEGHLRPVHDLMTTGDKWHAAAIHEYQRESIKCAELALDEMPQSMRDISTVSFAVNEEDFKEICSLAKDFRSSVMRIARESENADRVCQVNIQIFPLTRRM